MDIAEPVRELARELDDVPVVVTGGSGFVGLSLVLALAGRKGARLDVLDLAPPPAAIAAHLDLGRFRFHAVDLTRREAIDAVLRELPARFVLLHAASRVTAHSRFDLDAAHEIDSAARMTLALIDALGKRISTLAFVSSIDVFGILTQFPVDESHPVAPHRIYGVGKWLSEQLFSAAARELGFPLTLLRVGHVYGPFEHVHSPTHEVRAGRAIPSFLRSAIAGEPIRLYGEGEDLRDYVHSYDVAQATLRAALCGTGGSYVIASGDSRPIREVAEMAMRAASAEPRFEFAERTSPRLDYRYSIDKARRELGYQPCVELAAGLADEAAWMRKVGLHA